MSLDELRSLQKRISDWQEIGDRIRQALNDSLTAVEGGLREETGLKLNIVRHGSFSFSIHDDGMRLQIQTKQILHIQVESTSVEIGVEILPCSISRNPHGYNHKFYTATKGRTYWIEIEHSEPEVPIRIRDRSDEWTHNLWWSGATDSRKLQSAIIDSFEKRSRDSEFVIEPPKTKGCVSTTASAVAVVAAIAFVVYIF